MKKIIYVREKQLLKLFSVSRKVILDWKAKGLPFIKINKVVLFPIQAVNEWVISNASNEINKLVFERVLSKLYDEGNDKRPDRSL